MGTEYSNGTEIFKKQSDSYTLISQIQIRADNNNPDAMKTPGRVSGVKENFLHVVFKRSQFND